MDQLSAHLDRGWDLISRGDFRGARASARRAIEIDGDSPEAHNLLGYAAAQDGDADEALEHYRQAMALDDGYIDPMLNAAEVLIHPMQEYEEAIALCDEVLDFVEGPEEVTEATLLKFDALLALGDVRGARALLDGLPDEKLEGPMFPFMLGRAWFEAGESERAEPFLLDAIKDDVQNADAHYYLGLVREQRKDFRGATLSFLEARDLDLSAPKPPWAVPREQFLKAIERAVQAIDPKLVKHLEGALVLGAEAPGIEVVSEGVDPRVSVLIDGLVPKDVPGAPVDLPMPVRVYVYERNIERVCAGVEMLEEEITWQISEEIKFKLGMSTESGELRRPETASVPPPSDDDDGPARRKKSRTK